MMMSPKPGAHSAKITGIWILTIVLIYITLATFAISTVRNERQEAQRNHEMRMAPAKIESNPTTTTRLDSTPPIDVDVGVYLDGIENLSLKDSYWSAAFYVWFRWKGEPALDPYKTFTLVNGKVEKKELLLNYTSTDGTHYQRIKVFARISKFFNTTRVPLDDHMLNLYIEDSARSSTQLRYIADPTSAVSSRVKVPGYAITGFSQVVKPHGYKTAYGEPLNELAKQTFHSQYIFALTIQREGIGIYIKLFIGLFAGVVLTIGSFFIRPTDTSPRFGIPSAAYFGAVANTYLVNSILPPSDQYGLSDFVTGIGLITIFICVVSSLLSHHYFLKRDERVLANALDRYSCITISASFLVVNILLPLFSLS